MGTIYNCQCLFLWEILDAVKKDTPDTEVVILINLNGLESWIGRHEENLSLLAFLDDFESLQREFSFNERHDDAAVFRLDKLVDDQKIAIVGPTGAGKSILLGSMNLALGKKISKEDIPEDFGAKQYARAYEALKVILQKIEETNWGIIFLQMIISFH